MTLGHPIGKERDFGMSLKQHFRPKSIMKYSRKSGGKISESVLASDARKIKSTRSYSGK